jgi:hypothetical protein
VFRSIVLGLGLALPALVMQPALAAEPLPADQRFASVPAQWIPEDAVLVAEVSHPKGLLDLALDPKAAEAVTSLPAYQSLAAQPGFKQFVGVVKYLEAMAGSDWRTALRKLVGGGVTFAVEPQGTLWLIVDAEDPKTLEQLHEVFLNFARSGAASQGQPGRVVSTQYRGVTSWTFGGGEAHAILGRRLVLSNKPEGLKAALDLRAEPGGKSLASLPAYQAARKAAGSAPCGTVFVNVGALKQYPPFRQALTQSSNPLAALLFTGVAESLRESNWLALGLKVEGKTLALHAAADGKSNDPSGPAAFALPSRPDKGALPNLPVPRRIAGASFYRDLHAFYAAKDQLFPERTSGLIFFENMMGIFFSGMDLTEEVLGETEPEIRVVVARQEYDPAVGTPRLQIPAFAVIFRLCHPQRFGEVVEEAWQKAIGLVNFTRGQQAQPGLIIDRLFQGDTKFTVAYFRPPQEGARLQIDPRFNFRPSLAKLGDYLILSSTEALARDLIDALKQEAAQPFKPLGGVHSLVEVDATQVGLILDANRENLVHQNMLNKATTKQQAETRVDLLVSVMKYLGKAKLELTTQDGRPQADLELTLNLP